MHANDDDIWLDHMLAKTTWPDPSADLQDRIMGRIGGPVFPAAYAGQKWQALSLAVLVMFSFAVGFSSNVSGGQGVTYADGSYYSDTHFEYSNLWSS